ncbi:AMP-binding enzyme, partial [Agathobacter rectalis]|nr:o-succinylbenzoate--CoA ligase [Agathobacter rectalis]
SVDMDGFVMVYDRRKDLIISGGENIYPYEIETVVKRFDDITDAMCYAKDDNTWGQVPALYYTSEKDINHDALDTFLKEKLAKYKVPKYY